MNYITKNIFKETSILPSIFSLAIPLVQLFAVLSVEVSSAFSIDRLLFFPEILNLINFAVLLFTGACILTFWYWKEHEYGLRKNEEGNEKRYYNNEEKHTFKILWIGSIVALFCLLILMGTVMIKLYDVNYEFINKVGFLQIAAIQYIAYIGLLSSLGIVIYVGVQSRLEEIQQSREREDRDFKKNVFEVMSDMGHFTPRIWEKKPLKKKYGNIWQIGNAWQVTLSIGDQNYTLITSSDGSEIFEVKGGKVDRSTRHSIPNKP